MRTFDVILDDGSALQVQYPRSWGYSKIEQAIFSQYKNTKEISEVTPVDIW